MNHSYIQFLQNQEGDREAKPANPDDITQCKERGIRIIGVAGIGLVGSIEHAKQDILHTLSLYERFDNHMILVQTHEKPREQHEHSREDLRRSRNEIEEARIEELIFALSPRDDIGDIIPSISKIQAQDQEQRTKYFRHFSPKTIEKLQKPFISKKKPR